jgi:hypothetical protein
MTERRTKGNRRYSASVRGVCAVQKFIERGGTRGVTVAPLGNSN